MVLLLQEKTRYIKEHLADNGYYFLFVYAMFATCHSKIATPIPILSRETLKTKLPEPKNIQDTNADGRIIQRATIYKM